MDSTAARHKPAAMPDDTEVKLQGGVTLVFDEYGRLKFAISNQLAGSEDGRTEERQSRRLKDLWDYGHFDKGSSLSRRFSVQHRLRAAGLSRQIQEEW